MSQAASSAPTLPEISAAVHSYSTHRPLYQILSDWLRDWLETHCQELGLHALVTARAKEVASFAEKIIRKQYRNPLDETDDLCGVRVILNTPSEVKQVVEMIKDRGLSLFSILKDEDKLECLIQQQKFGYLSRHLVLQVRAEGELASVLSNLRVPAL